MKLLVDINVVLDVLLARDPWAADARRLLSLLEHDVAAGYVAGHTVTTIHYIVAREHGKATAAAAIADLLRIVHVVPLEDADFQQALVLGGPDFEDAVQASAALKVGADHLVTRNPDDFAGMPISLRTPGELIALLHRRDR